jgi:hypothetical protein
VVSRLQEQLRQLGHYTGAIDGIYGKKTEAAVAKFQRVEGLGVDGIVGPSTWQKLRARSGSSSAPANQKPADQKPREPSSPPAAAAPDEDAEPPVTPEPTPEPTPEVTPELRNERDTAAPRLNREPVENEKLYFWLLVWALVYGGGNIFIFWNRTISNLWFNFLEGITRQEQNKNSVAPTDVSHKQAASAVPTKNQSVKPTDRTTQPSTQTQTPSSAKTSHSTLQISAISSEQTHHNGRNGAQQRGDRSSSFSLSQEHSTTLSNSVEPVLIAALANGGFVEPLKNLVVDLSKPSKRNPLPSAHSNPPIFNTPVSRPGTMSGNRNSLTFNTPASIETNSAGNRTTIQTQNEPVNASKLKNGQSETPSDPSILVATLPACDPKTGNNYTYALLNDAEGCFKIKGNELRIADAALSKVEDKSRHVITVRRTDANGLSIDKSFILNLNKVEEEKPKSAPNSSTNSSTRATRQFPLIQPS